MSHYLKTLVGVEYEIIENKLCIKKGGVYTSDLADTDWHHLNAVAFDDRSSATYQKKAQAILNKLTKIKLKSFS